MGMKSKAAPYLILIILALAVYFLKKWKDVEELADSKTEVRRRGFDRRVSTLEYTKHALCRMDCRRISKSDVQEIMRTGEINYAKTDVNDQPCPTYALQGYTNDGEHLRVIFAQCQTKTKVVTCYDLQRDFKCHCPGDEKKTKRSRAMESSRN
jgi:hypothetical protein